MTTKVAGDRTVVFSVLYPGVDDAIVRDYVASMVNQTDTEFDWLMIRDRCGEEQSELFPASVEWIDVKTPRSFGKIREQGISFAAARGYDYIVFCDVDDYYSSNRVKLSKAYLKHNDFVFSELQIINRRKELLCSDFISGLGANPAPSDLRDILDHNYIGLSHSAVRLSALAGLDVPESLEVIDWWLFSVLLIHKHAGRLMREVKTFYRQNEGNYVGVFNLLDQERLQHGISVKLKHYSGLLEHCRRMDDHSFADILSRKYEEIVILSEKTADEDFARRYVAVVNANFRKVYRGWWSEILPLDRWALLEASVA
jgi:hypothetical protein